ncbi:MAG: FtsX-like permease family protein [Acidobacteriota bacterium]
METSSLKAALPLVDELRQSLPVGSQVRSWQDINRPLFFVLRLEKALMFVSVSLVVLVAALSLVSSLSLVVANKKSEIGMLGAMGATTGTLRRAFLLLGALLAGRGLAVGAACGMLGAWALDRFQLLKMPGDVFVFDYIPFLVRFSDVVAVVLLTLVLALGFSFLAANRAASVRPVRALAK